MPRKSTRSRSRPNDEENEQKSNITSGISTLFRRQPSPEPTSRKNQDYDYGAPAYGAPSSVRPADGSTRASSRSATHSASTKRASGRRILGSSRKKSAPIPSISYSATDESESYVSDGGESEYTSEGEYTATSEEESVRKHNRRSGRGDRGTKSDKTKLPRRYRGFSTSISSLFLDESIVCGAMACCGLLLSSRTEYLLNERNVKRGLTRRGTKSGNRAPSRILGISLVLTIVCVMATYVIWGFGEGFDVRAGGLEYDIDDYVEGGNDDNNGGRQGDDAVNQEDVADDGNQAVDDGAAGDDAVVEDQAADDGGAVAYDDAVNLQNNAYNDDGVNQAVDDGNVNAADDADVAQDDGAVQQQDDAAAQQQGDDYYAMADDAANRKLETLSQELQDSSPKHKFNGIMKMRDYREHIIEPVFHTAQSTYTDLVNQFSSDEYTPPKLPHTRALEDTTQDDIGSQARTLIIVIFLFMLGVVGRRRRMRTRFAILRSRAQDDHLYYASILTNPSGSLATPEGTLMENFHEREDKYDGACSHTLFGCYPVDSQSANYADYYEEEDDDATVDTAVRRQRKGGDFMHRTMTTLLNCCCGFLCKCWCQVFSICALAQEARETRLLLPPKMQRVDLITHQPFHEYAKDVNNVRRRFMEKASRTLYMHWAALSQLSRYILLAFILTVILVTVTLLVHPNGLFTWMDAMVLLATFVQSFLVLLVVFGIFHRSDLSFDAVVKFFAVGFVICVPVGFVLEGILINTLVWMLYAVYYPVSWMAGEDFDDWIIDNHRPLWVIAELINAYFVAALVEELCKYYGFRFLEHPDLIFLTGLDRTAAQASSGGGVDSYKFDSQIVSEFSRSHDSDCGSVDSRDRRRKDKEKLSSSKTKNDDEEEEPELRSLQQQAAAITTGMISVAVGLACAENFLYVFFLGGTGGASVSQEFAVLLFRSVFPVHALSAAMQSINMIRKFIEEKTGRERNVGVGKIVFPAVLLHGTFDAILMVVNSYVESKWDDFYEENDDYEDGFTPYNPVVVNAIAWVTIIGVMIFSFGWYTYQNQMQQLRLMKIEHRNKPRSKRGNFKSPDLV